MSTPEPMPAMAPHRAKVMRFDATSGAPMIPDGSSGSTDVADAPQKLVVKASRAERVFANDGPKADAAPAQPDWLKEFSPEDVKKLEEYRKAEGGVEKAYLHLQKKLGEQGTTVSALQAQINDMLAAQTKAVQHPATDTLMQPAITPPNIQALQAEIDQIGKNFLDDIPGNIKKLTELQSQLAEARVAPKIQARDEQSQRETAEALLAEYQGLFSDDPKRKTAEAAYVDALAASYGKPTLANYRKALDDFAKERGWAKTASATENPDVTAMREAASATAPTSAAVKLKGKIFKRSELENMLSRNPERYREMQHEIMLAYREGRVQ